MSAGWTYRRQYVKCGKPGCGCAAGAGHGPYWYGFRRVGDRVVSRYFGERRPVDAGRAAWEARRRDAEARVLAFTRRRPRWGKRSVARELELSPATVEAVWNRRGVGTTGEARAAWAAQPGDNQPGSLYKAALRLFGMRRELTARQIQLRYRDLAKRHHPDRGGDTEKMQRINAAYELLRRRAWPTSV